MSKNMTTMNAILLASNHNQAFLRETMGWNVIDSCLVQGSGDWVDQWVLIELPSGKKTIGYFYVKPRGQGTPEETFSTIGNVGAVNCPMKYVEAVGDFDNDVGRYWALKVREHHVLRRLMENMKVGDVLRYARTWSPIRSIDTNGQVVASTLVGNKIFTRDEVRDLVAQGDYATVEQHTALTGLAPASATKIDLSETVFSFDD